MKRMIGRRPVPARPRAGLCRASGGPGASRPLIKPTRAQYNETSGKSVGCAQKAVPAVFSLQPEAGMTVEEIRAEVAKIAFFHRIDLGHGIITPGVDDTPNKLQALGLPPSLEGLSVLDVGAWDGFLLFRSRAARCAESTRYRPLLLEWTRVGN
jgi:hypothetical protein